MLDLILKTVWLLLPTYTPNNFAVVVGGGKPIDFGKRFIDGKRVLGDGKTWRGFVGGVAGGILTANIQYGIEKSFGIKLLSLLPFLEFLTLSILLSSGAMIGDCVGSFIKRRMGYERGTRFLVVDQLTFLIVALILSSFYQPFWKLYSPEIITVGIIITPLLHLGINYIAFKLKLKEVPW